MLFWKLFIIISLTVILSDFRISPFWYKLRIFPCSASLVATANLSSNSAVQEVSPAGLFSIYLEVLLLLYTVVPLPLYGTLIIGVIYSLLFEILLCYSVTDRLAADQFVINLLLHICIHVIGIHILITIQVRNLFI